MLPQVSEVTGNPDQEILVLSNGTMVMIEFTPEDDFLPVAVGKTSVIVCGELGNYKQC